MILWIIKQIFSLKKAINGRAKPSELAWGLALGLAIGLIPKGNLVSILLIGLVVSVRVNHGIAALSAVLVSLAAIRFDPWTHELGMGVLHNPDVRQLLEKWWDAPLVPWTDLNNTVVMGSSVVAFSAIIPTYLISLPVFRWLAPRKPIAPDMDPPPAVAIALEQIDAGQQSHVKQVTSAEPRTRSEGPQIETQIEIIRMRPKSADERSADNVSEDNSMNEALGYLLRRLRDTKQEKAA